MFTRRAWTPMRPVIIGGLWYGCIFAAGASVLGLPVAISACVIGWLLATLAVGIFLVFASLAALRWRGWLVVLSVAVSVGHRFLVRTVAPLGWIVVVAGILYSDDPSVERLYSSLAVLSNAPPLGARIGNAVAGFLWAEYLYLAFAAVGFTSPRAHTEGSTRATLVLLCSAITVSACILGFSSLVPVTLVSFSVTGGLLLVAMGVVFSACLYLQARASYRASTVVRRHALRYARGLNVPWAIHLSDIHVTKPGGVTVEGGSGGNRQLQDAVQMQSSSSLSFVFITGDLTDHGEREEWTEAVSALERLSPDTQVLIAPGNHDLSIAYDLRWQFWTIVSRAYGRHNRFEHATGAKMWRFLKHLGMLNSELRTSDGQRLAKHTHIIMLDKEEDLYRRIAQSPRDESELIEGFVRWMREVRLCAPERENELKAQLRRIAACDHGRGFSRGKFDAFAGSHIFGEWPGYFPIHQLDARTSTLCVILSSVVADTSLIGSAFGVVQSEEINRLESLMRQSKARNIVILMHHAPFRWNDERSPHSVEEVVMWGSLAAARRSGEQLFKTLEATCRDGRRVVLLCGHRHGGRSRENRVGKWGPVLAAEAAAMADASAMEFLAFSHGARGPHLGVLQRSA